MLGLNKIYTHYKSRVYAVFYLYKLYNYRRNQFLSLSQLRKIQEQKLKKILQHAYDKVNYYKKYFIEAGINPDNINSLEDLVKIPITSRKDIQGLSRKEIIVRNTDINKCCNLRTSGSTGIPLDIFIDYKDARIRRASFLRMYFANGRKFKDKVLVITTPHNFLRRHWYHSLLYCLNLLREKYLSLYENWDNILRLLLDYKPDIILTYPSIIRELAWQIEKRKINCKAPRLIFLTGEMLSEKDRLFINSIFKAEVFNYYASNECGIIAWECRAHSGYHINSDNVIVEFIKEDGTYAKAGEEGDVVLTTLNSYTMPFIRYRIEDIGIPSDKKCPCGIGLPLMKIVTGRSNDYIILPNGKKISPYALMIIMDSISEVKKYRIIQEKENKVKIKIFQNEMITNETIAKINKRYQEFLGEDIEVETIVVRDINTGKTGKFKVIFTKISDKDDYQRYS